MTIHRIRLLGDPILRAKCEPITRPGSTAVRVIMDDMRETLRDWQSRFGSGRAIAAPQIGAPVRMIYLEMDKSWPMINPEIVDIGNEDFEVWDDCFSFPNLLIRVSRAYRIRVKYQDFKGTWQEVDLEGDRVRHVAAFFEKGLFEKFALPARLPADSLPSGARAAGAGGR